MILGISAYFHDSAACIVGDTGIIAAAQEERFTRKKHDSSFPINAINYCLEEANINYSDLEYVVYYEKPLLKFERLLETYLAFAPHGFNSFIQAIPNWLKQKLHLPREIRSYLKGLKNTPIIFTQHHESHAASAFFPSPFEEAAILTIDGVGEWDTATIGKGYGNRICLKKSIKFPHSLGLLYSAFTYFCGFKVNSGEYKLMGLAPYGKPIYYNSIVDHLININSDGSFTLNLEYFNYCQGLTMTSNKFSDLFGGPPRKPEAQITEREINLASSVQLVTEEIVVKMARHARQITGLNHLVMAGGVALNCVANGRIVRESIFDKVWIQPASGDAGGALGAALFAHYQLCGNDRKICPEDSMKGSFLGPSYSDKEINDFVVKKEIPHRVFENEDELLEKACEIIEKGMVVGWFQGKMEFGPRALGGRSIIGDARNPEMQSKMNLSIKFRESFRPFAPSVLDERKSDYFNINCSSPYMLLIAQLDESHCIRTTTNDDYQKVDNTLNLLNIVKNIRSKLPAITHVDYSARIQTVTETRNNRYYRLIKKFEEKTDCAVLVNTSFNIRGEPIVCSPEDAYRCFISTDMDALILENHLFLKSEQPESIKSIREKYISSFDLD